MNSRRKILAVLLLVVMAVSLLSVCALAADDGDDVAKSITCTTCNGTGISQGEECSACEGTGEITSTSRMAFSFWALVPPIVAIILALITKEVYSSLFVGILLGALFYSNFNPITGLDAIINDGMVPAVADSAGIMLFLVILGAMVALINRAGGSAAFGRWAETHIKTRAGAMFATFLLGVLIFVDDYFNCLTVGSVMLPVTDRHKISRAKLAYLIDATAAPVCMIAPISSWAAAVSGVVEDYNGFDLFVRAIPYNFYSLLTFVFIIALILMKFDYGPMRLHEMNYVDADPEFGQRLFFENSGGSLRLKASVEAQAKYQAFPDCPERLHDRSRALKKVQLHGIDDIMHIVFGASGGALISEMTASQAMFQIVGAILENCPGKSAVTSVLEHPSAYDAVKYYCDKTGKEFRVAQANPKTGGIDVEEIRRIVSPDTCLLSIMYASNITGSIMDMAGIVKAAREINPDIYIVTDAVQHAPHAVLDVDALGVDGATFAPYKFFGTRGMGYGYVSDRVAKLPHRKVLQRPADVWELGSPTPGNFAAMSAVVDYVCWLGGHFIQSDDRRTLFVTGMEHIHLQERALLHTMLEGTQNVPGLRHIPGVHVYVDTEDLTHRDLIVAMGIDGLDMTRCVEEYQKRGVTTFERVNTSVYSKRIVEAVGLTGAIRVSPLHCHTVADIETYLRVTQELAQAFAK